jgi:hypothetical protein
VGPNDKLARFLEHPSSAGLFLDFDGTLSEIVHIPSEARPVDGVPEVLQALTRRFAVVAVVPISRSGASTEPNALNRGAWFCLGAPKGTRASCPRSAQKLRSASESWIFRA